MRRKIALLGVLLLAGCSEKAELDGLKTFEEERIKALSEQYSQSIFYTTGLAHSINSVVASRGEEYLEHTLFSTTDITSSDQEGYVAITDATNIVSTMLIEDLTPLAEELLYGHISGEEDAEEVVVTELDVLNKAEELYQETVRTMKHYYFRNDMTGEVTVEVHYQLPTYLVRLETTWLGDVHVETKVYPR